MLPLPMRMGSIEEFIEQTRARMSNAECRIVIADAQLLAFLTPEPTDPPMVTLDELRAAVSVARAGRVLTARPTIPSRSRSCSSRVGAPRTPRA